MMIPEIGKKRSGTMFVAVIGEIVVVVAAAAVVVVVVVVAVVVVAWTFDVEPTVAVFEFAKISALAQG